MLIKTKEITEAAVFYANNLKIDKYEDRYWYFVDENSEEGLSKGETLRKDLINKEVRIEPLEFMDSIRRVKSFSNSDYLVK